MRTASWVASRQCVLLLSLFAAPVNCLLAQVLTLAQPQLVYDGNDGQIDLAPGVTHVAVDARGITFVSDWRRGGLFAFGSVANSPRRIGAHGRGPGEFTQVSGFGWLADTLWVSDADNMRLTLFPAWGGGKPLTIPFSATPGGVATTLPRALWRGTAVVSGSALYTRARAPAMASAQRVPILRVTRDGRRLIDTVTMIDVAKRMHEIPTADGVFLGRQPFVGEDLWAVSANGVFVATVVQSNAVSAAPSVLSLSRTDGERLLTKQFPQIAVPRSAFDRAADSLFDQLNTGRDGRRTNEFSRHAYLSALTIPRQAAPITNVFVSESGTILVVGPTIGKARVSHTIWSSRGELRGTFTLPAKQTVCGFDDRTVWSLDEQEDGALHLIRQAIRATPTQKKRPRSVLADVSASFALTASHPSSTACTTPDTAHSDPSRSSAA